MFSESADERIRAQNEALSEEHKKHLDAWQRSYFCHRCGQVFIPEGE
jgi:hypothetical protein